MGRQREEWANGGGGDGDGDGEGQRRGGEGTDAGGDSAAEGLAGGHLGARLVQAHAAHSVVRVDLSPQICRAG